MPDFRAKVYQKSFSAGAPPQTTLGELTALPRTSSWIRGPTSSCKIIGPSPTEEAVTITSCPCPVDFEIHEIRQVDSQENHLNFCHQMPDFRAKMHQKSISAPDPAGGAYSAPPDPLAGFRGLLLRGGEGRGGEGRGGEGRGGKGKEG